MKTVLTATVLLALVGSIASAQTTATPTPEAAPAAVVAPTVAAAPIATTTTTTAATEVKAARKWSGTLSFNPEMAAAGANRHSSERGRRTSLDSENFIGASYKITDKTTLSLRQYFQTNYDFSAYGKDAEHSYIGSLTPVVSTRVGGILGSKDINLQGRVYLGTGEDLRNLHINAMYLGVVDVPWEITSKLTLSYNFVPQAYGYWDQDTEVRFMNAGLASYQFTDKISMTQAVGWRPWMDSLSEGRAVREQIYLDTSASFALTDAVNLDLGIYQLHQTYGRTERSTSSKTKGSRFVSENAKRYEGDMTAYNENESFYYLATGVKF